MKKITLATLKDATEQEVFDQVCKHLKTQNEQSLKEGVGECLYRGVNGLMCAAGCLIADDEYKEIMDNDNDQTWGGLVSSGLVPGNHCELISRLQYVHDSKDPYEWHKALSHMAKEKYLDFNWDKF